MHLFALHSTKISIYCSISLKFHVVSLFTPILNTTTKSWFHKNKSIQQSSESKERDSRTDVTGMWSVYENLFKGTHHKASQSPKWSIRKVCKLRFALRKYLPRCNSKQIHECKSVPFRSTWWTCFFYLSFPDPYSATIEVVLHTSSLYQSLCIYCTYVCNYIDVWELKYFTASAFILRKCSCTSTEELKLTLHTAFIQGISSFNTLDA